MLYTDSDHVTAADLLALDYELAEVAETHRLTIEGTNSICGAAWSECGDRILAQFQHFGSRYIYESLTGWPTGTVRPAVALSTVVVDSAVKRWMVFSALEVLYRVVANASQKDRYVVKRKSYASEAASAWRRLSRAGLPAVRDPLACPGAVHQFAAGAFGDPALSTTASGTRPSQAVIVAITYWDAARPVESGPSATRAIEIPANSLLAVSRAGCNPPAKATHWNVYAGESGTALCRQNVSPIAIGTVSWTATGLITSNLNQLGSGQAEDFRSSFSNFLQRS